MMDGNNTQKNEWKCVGLVFERKLLALQVKI